MLTDTRTYLCMQPCDRKQNAYFAYTLNGSSLFNGTHEEIFSRVHRKAYGDTPKERSKNNDFFHIHCMLVCICAWSWCTPLLIALTNDVTHNDDTYNIPAQDAAPGKFQKNRRWRCYWPCPCCRLVSKEQVVEFKSHLVLYLQFCLELV